MTALDPRSLRDAFGRFMTGVTVVTARAPSGEPVGFTANSFASVSLDPPLLLVCPGRFLSSYDVFADCTDFAVSVLAEGQEDVANTFASFKGDRFAKVAHDVGPNDVPLIAGAIAQFTCRTHQIIPTGDHCVLIGEVTDTRQTAGHGLGYVGGKFFSLGLERADPASADQTNICGAIVQVLDTVLLEATTEGLRPPQCTTDDHASGRSRMYAHLARHGIAADIGAVYSIFSDDAASLHSTYFLADAANVEAATGLTAYPIADLASLPYTSPAITSMMTRFALESQTRNFSLYLGDTEKGDVHTTNKRP